MGHRNVVNIWIESFPVLEGEFVIILDYRAKIDFHGNHLIALVELDVNCLLRIVDESRLIVCYHMDVWIPFSPRYREWVTETEDGLLPGLLFRQRASYV